MIVQFRNEKVSNHGSIPITIDCNVVAFIVFEEGFHQPIKRTKHVGRESTEDDQRPGHLVTVSGVETVTKINQIVRADRRMSIRMIVEAVNADKEMVRKILYEELHMTKVCAKLVSKNLTPDQKLLRQQDKAPAHNALSVKRYLADKRTPVLEHAPYSPDLAPSDFFLFPKIKSALKGTRFESMEAVKQKTAELLKALTKEDFQHCFDQWGKRMERGVARGGEYIEGEHSNVK
ncbi:putative mariner transposase [Trichonephila clavipes]|nr:putative mariner transposase [Trichonephila clavipes]